MLSWDQTKTPRPGSPGSPSNPLDDVATIPNGTYPVGSLSIVADDQAIYLVMNVSGASGSVYSPMRQIGILLAERQEAKDSKEAAASCSHALLTKFGQDTAVEIVKFLAKEYGSNWALKYIPLDDHIFELYDEARIVTSVLATRQGGDTW